MLYGFRIKLFIFIEIILHNTINNEKIRNINWFGFFKLIFVKIQFFLELVYGYKNSLFIINLEMDNKFCIYTSISISI